MARKCSKKRYATREEANAAIDGMARKWTIVFKKAYRCGKCKAWHITSRPYSGPRRLKH